ncbi:aggregation-promoting factor C-terminal-like domain-containing protein [Lactobacillus porci]|uniref:Aggregation promoting factor n=1 Tax=Lactobacillus porci TaxID=2012477 RepID=A0A6A8MD15_9LACO|nr:aggregation promoting factor [Lactobacillus porci]MST86852.1 aggregation promoting factor [Lactobacillus porci]
MNIKSNVLKSVFAAGLALTGVAAISLGTNGQADAATVGGTVTVDYIDGQSIATWSNYENAKVTGSAKDGSSWTVLKTAKDLSGHKWYKIGAGQWILAKYTHDAAASSNTTNSTASSANNYSYKSNVASNTQSYSYSNNSNASSYANYGSSSNASSYSNTSSNYSNSYSSAANTSSSASSTTSSSSASSSESAAKAWIANKESGGSYTASNGNYYGKYQLSRSLLGGNTSAAAQEAAADSYVASRYGSWTAAKSFWEANGWY